MIARPLADGFSLICGTDRRLHKFENMFTLPKGISYNSFFLDDDKTVVLDTADAAVADEFMASLQALLAGRELDYVIVNHAEPDHCAALARLMERYPACHLYTSALALQFIQQFSRDTALDWEGRTTIIKEGDTLETGQHKLRFIKAQNVHWPEVMVTYDEASGSLFSADAFGSFGAPEGYMYADQVNYMVDWLPEFRRYYTNIVGRQGPSVNKLLDKLAQEKIKNIYPLHGLLFRTPDMIDYVIDKYRHWASYEAEEAGTVIVYSTLYDHSKQLADTLAAYLADQGAGAIRIYDISETNPSYIVADCFRFSHAVFICNNYNTELYPPLDAFLRELMMLHWDNHSYSIIGNKSWGGRGAQIAEDILSAGKNLERIGGDHTITSSLAQEDLAFLQDLAGKIKEGMADFSS